MTKEHVWPRWSHRYLPKGKKRWFAMRATEHRDRTDFRIRKYAGDPLDWTVKCVDERCNNGWMRELEDCVRPIMLPLIIGNQSPRFLGATQQRILSSWIALKTMVQEYGQEADRISHYTQLRRLRRSQLAPEETWRIWIAQYDGRAANTLWASHPMLILPDAVVRRRKNPTATYYNSQAATYAIGNLFIHLIRSPHKRLVRRWRFHPTVATKLSQIWPRTGYDTRWPLDPLTDAEAGYVAWAVRSFVRDSGA